MEKKKRVTNLGGLWKQESVNVGKYFRSAKIKASDIINLIKQQAGDDDLINFLVYVNTDKKNEKAPDISLTVAKWEPKQ